MVIKFLGIEFPDSELFLVEALEEIERRLFQNGSPVINMAALVNEEFVVAGEVMASSIAQGGPAPNIMNMSSFSYIAYGVQSVEIDSVVVEDVVLKAAIDKASILFNVVTVIVCVPCWVVSNYKSASSLVSKMVKYVVNLA